jgi:hypothetical protein
MIPMQLAGWKIPMNAMREASTLTDVVLSNIW